MKGWVYILGNAAMPGLVKIGKTTRSVEQRMEELYQTGVPCRFGLHRAELFPDCHSAERQMHEIFSNRRFTASREFFYLADDTLEKMGNQLDSLLREQVEELISEFMPDHVVRCPDLIIDECDVSLIARQAGIDPIYVASSFSYIDPDAVVEACRKVEERIEARRAANALV